MVVELLVLGAAGGVGLAVIRLAAGLGAEVRGQTGSRGETGAIDAAGGQPLVTDAAGLAVALGEWRPTVVIDPLGGPFTPAALDLLAAHGRHAVIGTSAGVDVTIGLQGLYRRGIALLGYGGILVSPEQRRAGLTQVLAALADGRKRMPVDRIIDLADVGSAFDALADRTLTGKVVLALS